jgi:hypothetical protein
MSASFLQPPPTARLPDASSISATSSPDSPFRQRRHVVSSGKTEPPSHPDKRNELDTPAPRQDSRIAPTPVPCAARPGAGPTSRFRRAAGVTCRDRPSRVTVVVANAKSPHAAAGRVVALAAPPHRHDPTKKRRRRPPPHPSSARHGPDTPAPAPGTTPHPSPSRSPHHARPAPRSRPARRAPLQAPSRPAHGGSFFFFNHRPQLRRAARQLPPSSPTPPCTVRLLPALPCSQLASPPPIPAARGARESRPLVYTSPLPLPPRHSASPPHHPGSAQRGAAPRPHFLNPRLSPSSAFPSLPLLASRPSPSSASFPPSHARSSTAVPRRAESARSNSRDAEVWCPPLLLRRGGGGGGFRERLSRGRC